MARGGGGVGDVLLGVGNGGGKQFVASRQSGANRNGWALKSVLFLDAVEARVLDGMGGAVQELECGRSCVYPRDCS